MWRLYFMVETLKVLNVTGKNEVKPISFHKKHFQLKKQFKHNQMEAKSLKEHQPYVRFVVQNRMTVFTRCTFKLNYT